MMLVSAFPLISQVTVIHSLDSRYSPCSLPSLLLFFLVCCNPTLLLGTPSEYERKSNTHQSSPYNLLEICINLLHNRESGLLQKYYPPLSIPRSSVTSSKISKRVNFSEMSVILSVVVGGYEKEKRKEKVSRVQTFVSQVSLTIRSGEI